MLSLQQEVHGFYIYWHLNCNLHKIKPSISEGGKATTEIHSRKKKIDEPSRKNYLHVSPGYRLKKVEKNSWKEVSWKKNTQTLLWEDWLLNGTGYGFISALQR